MGKRQLFTKGDTVCAVRNDNRVRGFVHSHNEKSFCNIKTTNNQYRSVNPEFYKIFPYRIHLVERIRT